MTRLAPSTLLLAALVAGCSGPSEPQPEPVPITLNDPGTTGAADDPGGEAPGEGEGTDEGFGLAGGETPEPLAEGTPCTRYEDCAQGEICAGPEGCDVAWTCQPSRACTRDLVTYCGCDGQTIQGSGSCPPGPYSRRGPC